MKFVEATIFTGGNSVSKGLTMSNKIEEMADKLTPEQELEIIKNETVFQRVYKLKVRECFQRKEQRV